MRGLNLLVIGDPAASHMKVLARLPEETTITAGDRLEGLAAAAPEADVILVCTGRSDVLRQVWPLARKVRWVHALAAGVEGVLFDGLIESPVPLTNARGVYKRSLAEFVIASMLYFAKDLPRMRRSQQAGVWDQFDVDMLDGAAFGVVGFGEIGRAAAKLAGAFGMRILAARRRGAQLPDNITVEKMYALENLRDMLRESDYVLVSSPLTPETRGLVGAAEFDAMRPNAVLINVGRGPVVDEAALIRALEEKRIRGAALDVFDIEPLPAGHPFWRLDNVLLSPHTADHTATWLEETMAFFVENFERFSHGKPLENVVDKRAGY